MYQLYLNAEVAGFVCGFILKLGAALQVLSQGGPPSEPQPRFPLEQHKGPHLNLSNVIHTLIIGIDKVLSRLRYRQSLLLFFPRVLFVFSVVEVAKVGRVIKILPVDHTRKSKTALKVNCKAK